MVNWKVKATVQKSISYLPIGHDINHLLQKYVTKGIELTEEYFYTRVHHAHDHIAAYNRFYSLEQLDTSLEIGTGWYPIIPLSLFLSGVEEVYSLDIERLYTKESFQKTVEMFIQLKDDSRLNKLIPIKKKRMELLESLYLHLDKLTLEKALHLLNFHFIVGDAECIRVKSGSIQLIHSNNTFEHIYPDKLFSILEEFKRLGSKTNGVMSHFIDMSDHFAHSDSSITIYNFLRFSDKEWKAIDNSIQPQNRLRFCDYIALYDILEIPVSHTETRPGDLNALRLVDLDRKYLPYAEEDLAISHGSIVSQFGL